MRLSEPTRSITLNAAEIDFHEVTITAGGTHAGRRASTLDADSETATLTVPQPIPAGAAAIAIRYTGRLNDQLRGFYLSRANNRDYAITQLEPTDARRAFPSFDEPAMKATFAVSATIDTRDTAISNGRLLSDTPGPGAGKHTLTVRHDQTDVALPRRARGRRLGVRDRAAPTAFRSASAGRRIEKTSSASRSSRRSSRCDISTGTSPSNIRSRSSTSSRCPTSPPARWRTPAQFSFASSFSLRREGRRHARATRKQIGAVHRPRDRASVVRRSRDDGVVGRHLAERGVRNLDGVPPHAGIEARVAGRARRGARHATRDGPRHAARDAARPHAGRNAGRDQSGLRRDRVSEDRGGHQDGRGIRRARHATATASTRT